MLSRSYCYGSQWDTGDLPDTAPVSIQPHVREDNLYLLFQLLLRPLPCESWDFPRGVGKGVGHKGECPTWEGRKQRNWTGSGSGERKFTLDI